MKTFLAFLLLGGIIYIGFKILQALFSRRPSRLMMALVGGIIGGLLLGLLGAIIGAATGYFLGRHPDSTDQQPQTPPVNQLRRRFLIYLPAMMAKMVMADGEVDEREIEEIVRFYTELGFSDEDIKTVAHVLENTLHNNSKTIYEDARLFAEGVETELNELAYWVLWKIAAADGHLDKAELDILKNITSDLKLPPHAFDALLAEFLSPDAQQTDSEFEAYKQACELLGCQPDDSMQKIKSAYRKRVSEYHPDKLQAKGLPQEFLTFAKEKTQQLNQAYETIKNYKKL